MLGAIIGDIAGSRFEFAPTNNYNFALFTRQCSFTDDTICTVAVADALLNERDFGESVHNWCRRYPHPMGGYGGRFAAWVHSNHPQPYNSFGNGAAMRVSPVAYWYNDEKQVLQAALRTAAITHNHPEGIKGAQTVALAIFKALLFGQQAPSHVNEIIAECVTFSGYDIQIKKEYVINRFDETCQGTVPVALWIISQSKSFEDAIRRAVSLGTDADTLGAIVGSIAEAIWGIPQEYKEIAMSYLSAAMKDVIHLFNTEIQNRR